MNDFTYTFDEFMDDKKARIRDLKETRPHRTVYSYETRIVQCGPVYEVYVYENRRFRGYEAHNNTGRLGSGSADVDSNRSRVLQRARLTIRNTVNCNYTDSSKFLTLTFKDNVTDIETANKEFMRFIKRLNYNVFKSKTSVLKYTVVPETQKRGAIHFHVVCYNLPYVDVKTLADIWGNGFIKLNKIDNVDNVGAYICKYLSKEECEVFKGKKCYFNSRNLNKPIEYTQQKKVTQVLTRLNNLIPKINKEYQNEYTGKVTYKQYVNVDAKG